MENFPNEWQNRFWLMIVFGLIVILADGLLTGGSVAAAAHNENYPSIPRFPVDRQIAASFKIDDFFALWNEFADNNNDTLAAPKHLGNDSPYTILAPINSAIHNIDSFKKEHKNASVLRELLLNYVLNGDLSKSKLLTWNGQLIKIHNSKSNVQLINEQYDKNTSIITVHTTKNGTLIAVIDNDFLLTPIISGDNQQQLKKKTDTSVINDFVAQLVNTLKSTDGLFNQMSTTMFQKFVMRANITRRIPADGEYTVFVPIDNAFQLWHPIDWGFYPFIVPEFTEEIIINHFVATLVPFDDLIKNGGSIAVKSLGGQQITLHNNNSAVDGLTANDVTILKYANLPSGNKGVIAAISSLLFINDTVVAELNEKHRDKETPPLVAYPWFGAQFLSHAFLALQRDNRFNHVTRFLSLVDLAPYLPGANYTFFVPTDDAFTKTGWHSNPNNYLATESVLFVLLKHFVRGRFYDNDLYDGRDLISLANRTLHFTRTKEGVVKVNNKATIQESEVFVYNLGTMYYINQVLIDDDENDAITDNNNNKLPTPQKVNSVNKEKELKKKQTLSSVLNTISSASSINVNSKESAEYANLDLMRKHNINNKSNNTSREVAHKGQYVPMNNVAAKDDDNSDVVLFADNGTMNVAQTEDNIRKY